MKSKLVAMLLLVLFACKAKPKEETHEEPNHGPIVTKPEANKAKEALNSLDSFTELPAEIDGCACYFSKDEAHFAKKEYCYANNYQKLSFLKINGKMVKFTETERKDISRTEAKVISKSDDFVLEIQAKKGKSSGDETHLYSGSFTISDSYGKSIKMEFYGECGC